MLFAVNVTAVLPITPSNLGVFQFACVAVLAGAYGVGKADALAYGIILQAVEIATAVVMGAPALVKEGMSWRDVRLRALHASPVQLDPLPPGRGPPTDRRRRGLAGISRRAAKPLAVPDAWVYLLRCADGSLYTGWTVDLDARLRRHGAGTASAYTRSRLPVELALALPMADRTRREARGGADQGARSARRSSRSSPTAGLSVWVPNTAGDAGSVGRCRCNVAPEPFGRTATDSMPTTEFPAVTE